jgi:uncharacterized protein YbaR (Trm112 family)
MRRDTIKKLCCSFDKADLELTVISKDVQDNIIEGILCCSRCRKTFPIISGIPIMSPDEYREYRLERPLLERWTKAEVPDNFRLPETDGES